MKLTFKLLSDILRIFDNNGIISIYWNGSNIQTISEDSQIDDLKNIPEDCSIEKDFYVEFPGGKEIKFDEAINYIAF